MGATLTLVEILALAQISERADRRREIRLPGLSIYLACAAMLFPQPAAGQRAFAVESDVTVRADSFACKETSELDRLLQRNQSGGFTSGTQLYDYLKAHKCIGLTAGRASVLYSRAIRLHLRAEKQQDELLSLCLDSTRDAVAMNE